MSALAATVPGEVEAAQKLAELSACADVGGVWVWGKAVAGGGAWGEDGGPLGSVAEAASIKVRWGSFVFLW